MKYRALSLWIAVGMMSAMAASCSNGTPMVPTEPTPAPAATVTLISVTSGATTGVTFQLGATARLSDGTTIDVTSTAVWDSSDAGVASIAQGGSVTVRTSGTVDLRATYRNMSGSTRVIVTRVPLVSIAVTGVVTPAASFQLTATGLLTDGSTQDLTRVATWESSDTTTATVSSTGFVNVLQSGPIEFRATYQGVTGALQSLLSPALTFALTGTITTSGSNPQPLAGAQVRLLEPGLSGNPTITDASGAFSFSALSAGRHLIEVSKTRYETLEAEVVIVDSALQVTLTLDLTGVTP